MRFTFLGCGDAFGSDGRFNTCFHVTADDGDFLIDCGASAMIALRRFAVEPNAIRTIVLSHLHGDHFGGLPFFLLDAQFYSKRTGPLTVVGPEGTQARVEAPMDVFFPGSSGVSRRFDTEFVEIAPGRTTNVNNLAVTGFEGVHPCGAPPLALRIACGGKTIAYTGDTEWVEGLVEAGAHADLFVAETLFYERKVRYHLDYASLAENLGRIAPRRLALTHMGPDMLENRHRIPEDTVLAEDGLQIDL